MPITSLPLLPLLLACRWESNGYFKPDAAAAGQPYVLSMPPPNVTGKLHMGHAMFATLQVGAAACWRWAVAVARLVPFGFRRALFVSSSTEKLLLFTEKLLLVLPAGRLCNMRFTAMLHLASHSTR